MKKKETLVLKAENRQSLAVKTDSGKEYDAEKYFGALTGGCKIGDIKITPIEKGQFEREEVIEAESVEFDGFMS